MERVQAMIAGSLAAALGLTGCQMLAKPSTTVITESPVTKVTQSVSHAMGLSPAAPASQCVCFWQRRLSPLPDPTRDGMQINGLAGQVFLVAPDSTPADIAGDVTVAGYDETPRANGAEPKKPQLWHFDKATLQKLVSGDERFGRSIVVYLPWPEEWKDVTAVRLATRYDVPGQPTLFAGDTRLSLDTGGGPVWTETGSQPNAATPAQFDVRSVPDGGKIARQVNAKDKDSGIQAASHSVPAVTAPPAIVAPPAFSP